VRTVTRKRANLLTEVITRSGSRRRSIITSTGQARDPCDKFPQERIGLYETKREHITRETTGYPTPKSQPRHDYVCAAMRVESRQVRRPRSIGPRNRGRDVHVRGWLWLSLAFIGRLHARRQTPIGNGRYMPLAPPPLRWNFEVTQQTRIMSTSTMTMSSIAERYRTFALSFSVLVVYFSVKSIVTDLLYQ
jgi:hypothetical protein